MNNQEKIDSYKNILKDFIPEKAVDTVANWIIQFHFHLKITENRNSKLGDYRSPTENGVHQITVNHNLNQYSFFITLVHEIAHLVAFEKFGRNIKPHGEEWKLSFQRLMVPFIRPEIFPHQLLSLLAKHFRNPKASSDTDAKLAIALKQFDQKETDKNYVFEIPMGSHFRISNGKIFKKIALRVKRYECQEISTGRMYLFQPNAEVELLPN